MEVNLNSLLFYKREFHVQNIDDNGNPSLFEIFDNFQKAAIPHADLLGFGNSFLQSHNLLIVICRMKIQFYKRFHQGKKYTLVTFPFYPDKIHVYRDAIIFDDRNEKVAALSSLWVMLDRVRRRITLMTELQHVCDKYHDEMKNLSRVFPEGLISLQFSLPSDSELKSKPYVVTESDIDVNYHLNNAVYAKILDDFKHDGCFKSVEINFDKECLLGETLLTYRYSEDTCDQFIGYKEDKSISYKAQIFYY